MPLVRSICQVCVAAVAAFAPAVVLAQADAWVKPAEMLRASTVTVRVSGAPGADASPASAESNTSPAEQAVTICTGVGVGQGYVVTCVAAGSDSRIRLTLPSGSQAEARIRVIDEYSGLTILQCDKLGLPNLEIVSEPPAAGSGLLIASAWGTEKPVVSVGTIAGVDRLLSGATCPPLIQSDVRTTDTSSGAGLVNSSGQLIGIVVAVDHEASRRGWTYAVPASHLRRLLRMAAADSEKSKEGAEQGVIMLRRQRPVVGLRLEGAEDSIVVHRITEGGPAEKAGLKVGDQVLATDGVNIRSVYQAVLPTLHKQPGDTMRFRVRRQGAIHNFDVVLGGGVEVPSVPLSQLRQYIQPQLQVGRDEKGEVVSRRSARDGEVFALPAEPKADATATPAEKMALLEKALDRYRGIIEYQQRQLQEERQERTQIEQRIQVLQDELGVLQRQMEPARAAKK